MVSLAERILGVMAHVRRLIQEAEMRKTNMKRIVALLGQLSPSQLKAVAVEMAALEARSGATAVLEGRGAAGTPCPHCQSERLRLPGQANRLQRYRCVECRRTFNALSGAPLSGLHQREKWLGQAEALQDARPLRAVAKELGIHVGTAHRWRHRFLACPQAAMSAALVGIAEVDETMFLFSFKGQRTLPRQARKRGGKAAKRGLSDEQVPVLVARDRAGVTADCVLKATDAATLAALQQQYANCVKLLVKQKSRRFRRDFRTRSLEVITRSLPSFGCIWHIIPSAPCAHSHIQRFSVNWGGTRGWLPASKSFGYDQRSSSCHMLRTSPLLKYPFLAIIPWITDCIR